MTVEKVVGKEKQSCAPWVGQHHRYPDLTGARRAEGGRRVKEAPLALTGYDGPRISIVTVVYNRVNTIERAIRSILEQKYQNIEHIIVDGGSDDGTLDILAKYQEQIEYFISEPDGGVYDAMNKGISLAAGDYICLLNADDYYDATYFASAVATAKTQKADIICGAIEMNSKRIMPKEMNAGIYLGHLDFFHGTFLVSNDCYNSVGPYREDFKIVSDTYWVQQAFLQKKRFALCKQAIVYFSDGGLSSGNTPERRELLITESVKMYKERFPFLTDADAQDLYLFRFGKQRIDALKNIVSRYCKREPEFKRVLKHYVEYCFSQRSVFVFEVTDIEAYFLAAKTLLCSLEIDPAIIRVKLPSADMDAFIERIDALAASALKAKKDGKQTILHFAEKFSTPSETFIYDLLLRMQARAVSHNVMLCDERRLKEERPYEHCLEIPWPELPYQIKIWLYERLFEKINPDVLICHFAASGRWLYDRINVLNLRIPTIHMTHGIDVFAIDTNQAYKEFIKKHAVIDPQTEFTAVSNYLARELVARDVPSEKITVISNTVHPRFFENRKSSNFFDGSRELRILNIGRLIPLKGHRYLIEGFRYFLDATGADARLTIVYGGADSEIESLRAQINHLNLVPFVDFVDYVNFNEDPDFFSKFDLFILPSTYSDDMWKRSESFGMSTLEAIAAGLPVIVSDAGGSPEIIGDEEVFAKIVPHGNAKAIGDAITDFYQKGDAFRDNLDFAQACQERFSPQRQLDLLGAVIDRVKSCRLKTAIFSSIASGGAGGAAVRVHESLLRNGVNSTLITRDRQHLDRKTPFIRKIRPDLAGHWDILQTQENQQPGNTIFTVNEPRLTQETIQRIAEEADVINIQWIARMLSVENVAYLSHLGKPLVITIRDMQPLTGGCHFFHGCEQWKRECFSCPQLKHDERDLPHRTQSYKLQNWNRENITVVALSDHSADLIRQSPLLGQCRVEVIANPIDLEIFSPSSKDTARAALGIPRDEYAVFYIPSFNSKVKGRDELKEAMRILRQEHPSLTLNIVVAGAGAENLDDGELTFPTISLGMIHNKHTLAQIYTAVDATLIPSLEETFSNTAAESVACGTPVVGFATGAIGAIAGNGKRGLAMDVSDCAGLARGLYKVLTGQPLTENCRKYAIENFSFEKQGARYKRLFESLVAEYSARHAKDIQQVHIPLINEENAPLYFERQTKTFEFKRRDAVVQATQESQARIKLLEGRLSHIKALANSEAIDSQPSEQTVLSLPEPLARRQRIADYLRKRHLAIYRFAQLGAWSLRRLRQQPVITGFGVIVVGSLLAAPYAAPSLSSNALLFWVLAAILLGAGFAHLLYSFVRHKQTSLQKIIDRNERIRQRIIVELKGSK